MEGGREGGMWRTESRDIHLDSRWQHSEPQATRNAKIMRTKRTKWILKYREIEKRKNKNKCKPLWIKSLISLLGRMAKEDFHLLSFQLPFYIPLFLSHILISLAPIHHARTNSELSKASAHTAPFFFPTAYQFYMISSFFLHRHALSAFFYSHMFAMNLEAASILCSLSVAADELLHRASNTLQHSSLVHSL